MKWSDVKSNLATSILNIIYFFGFIRVNVKSRHEKLASGLILKMSEISIDRTFIWSSLFRCQY